MEPFLFGGYTLTYTVANQTFPTKKALREYIQGILYSYKPNEELNDEDFNFMRDLLNWHYKANQKIGCGVVSMSVRINREFGNNRSFWLTRLDGSETDFSFYVCLKPPAPLQDFKSACRNAIHDTILKIKHDFFSTPSNKVCPFTGNKLTPNNSHVDHAPPNTFDVIVEAFIDRFDVNVESVKLIDGDGVTQNQIADDKLRKSFIEFHNDIANLRIITAEANLSHVKVGKEPQQPKLF